ncbi:hypothetical protein CTAYLR_001574 [Chrysophaeum taylorii]|uniref:Uncharacterized protein n=1 Tax=Chrysophaeum taylorii TaxID=2483200 RepID=A0AAD7UFD7_9STRA|nr:hypothetical protein CTAYLR_001574 [Chrysophaeum taylorii]
MAEEFARNRQYEYKANSNLVLEADRETRRRSDEPTGEVESLWGRLGSQKMGDKVAGVKASDVERRKRLEKKLNKKKNNKRSRETTSIEVVPKRAKAMTEEETAAAGGYVPRTKESRAAFEAILGACRAAMGDVPHDVLRGAGEEVVYLLKDDKVHDRKAEIERLLGAKLGEAELADLVACGKRVGDFEVTAQAVDEGERLDEEMGVAVVFDDDDESDEAEDDVDEVRSEEDDDDAVRGVEAERESKLVTGVDREMDDEQQEDEVLDVHEIDAHWLQRGLSKFYDDANVSARLAADVVSILGPEGGDGRACENKLVMLLDYDKFDFIKLLMRNRSRILYCTLLKQAQSDEERAKIEADMAQDVEGGGAAILEALRATGTAETWAHDRAADFASRTRKEALGLTKLAGVRVDDDHQKDDLDEQQEVVTAAAAAAAARGSAPERTLDLAQLAFQRGGHVMTNKRCELPPKSWRAQKKGYEEVHVPAVRNAAAIAAIPLRPIDSLPEWARAAFDGMKTLNPVQSKAYDAAMTTAENLLLCAPTGAGKTNCAVLAMLNQVAAYRTASDDDPGSKDVDTSAFKMVYVAPMKALVQECVLNFSKRLAPYGIVVRELSGDQNLTYAQLQETTLIVTTPEKWDIVTRKGADRAYTQLVRLVIIDEIHLLHDDRGPVLESIVARTIRNVETTQENVRLVGLSATLPNFADVAALLRVDPAKGLFFFDNSFRPVPLQQQYIGLTEKKAIKRFQLMNKICFEKVMAQAGKNQVLIFVHSRAETAKTATALRDMALETDVVSRFIREDSATREILQEECETAKNDALRDLLPYGFAIHHAGMTRADRNLVEDLFADKHIQVLCSTATLAWGVNLPAHTVIIKGTQIYSPERGTWVELSPLDIVQMLGRAGRPQYDTEGEGIVLTKATELQYYLSLMNEQLPVESQLVKVLPDHLNAEIEMGNVQSIRQAADWLAYTYLYVRAAREPERYGATTPSPEDDPTLLQHRLDLAHSAAVELDKHNLVKYDKKTGAVQITALGRVAAHYYVSYESMATYNEHLKPNLSDIELFRLFSFSGEFKYIHVRDEEKLELAKLATRVPIPIKESMEEPSAKINALLQAYISNLKLEGFALVADMTFVRQSAARLCRAIFEIALRRRWAAMTERALTLCKMVERRSWLSQSPLRQFKGVPETIVRKLEKKEIPWDRYYDLKPQDLAELVKLPKMGKNLHRLVHQIPRVELAAHVQPVSRGLLRIELSITPDFQFDPKVHDTSQLFHVLVEDVDGERVLHHEPFSLRHAYADQEHVLQFAVPVSDPLPPQYFLKVVSDRWLHSTATLPVSFRHLVLPRKYPPHTDLLDLQPLPVSALGEPAFERLYEPQLHFNPIQTQTFAALYESDDNVVVCAPNGSGRLVCAEFAVLRALRQAAGACVYVAPKREVVARRLADWRRKFGPLGATVVELTGDVASDLRALDGAEIVVATAARWDVLSRRWKQRKAVQRVRLFVADELHCLGARTEGPTLEVVVSRMRYVSSQLERPPRIVGLGSSLADGKDVGDWLGATGSNFFSFHSNVRPVPMELFLHAFDTPHFASRLLAMGKVLFNVLARHAPDEPAIIFVASRKQAQLTAIDVMVHAATAAEAGAPHFAYHGDDPELLGSFDDPALRQTVSRGVAFSHAGLSDRDRDRVDALYRDGKLWVLVVPADACWATTHHARLVVVMGTERYDARTHRYVDYAVSDLLEMIGKAGRVDDSETGAKCAVFCHAPKKEYLKRLLYEPLPVESHLDRALHEHLNAEIVTKTIETKQDAVDYLTWTFFYRRLTQNPNYYDLQGTTHRHVSDHLSELVENVINDLADSRCVAISEENEVDVSPLNLGMIAAYYCIQYTTVELFASSITATSKIPALLEILANATEFATALPARHAEDRALDRLARHLPHLKLSSSGDDGGGDFSKPHVKTLVLLHAHFARLPLSPELAADRDAALLEAPRLVQALVDVVSSNGWLAPALHAMELAQMLVQGLWNTDHTLLQIPHVDRRTLDRLEAEGRGDIDSVFDILSLDDDVRDRVLSAPPHQMAEIAAFCNDYPNIELTFDVLDPDDVVSGEAVALAVALDREVDDDNNADGGGGSAEIGRVRAHRYPGPKKEAWWLVVADVERNTLLSIKRLAVQREARIQLDFVAPAEPGEAKLTLYFMCDSYVGCDQEFEFKLAVKPGSHDMVEDNNAVKG